MEAPRNPIGALMDLHELLYSHALRSASGLERARLLCIDILYGFRDHPQYAAWNREHYEDRELTTVSAEK
jgi:hypothetical protein